MSAGTILIVDDEKAIVDILKFNLQREGFETLCAYDGLDGLRLSVYYIDPSILTRFPLTEERLLSFESVQRFDVDNAQLLQNIELLKTINAEEMTPVSNTSVLDARLCCIFESDRAGQILRIGMVGHTPVKIPLLPYDAIHSGDKLQSLIEPERLVFIGHIPAMIQ